MTGKNDFNLEKFLPYRLNQAAEAASLAFQDIYRKRHGMTRPEWRVLANLGQFGSMTATDISNRAKIHKTKVSRAVFALEKRRWLKRETDGQDRRVEHLHLTREGLASYGELGKVALELDRKLRGRLSEEEHDRLLNMLKKLDL
jgi:DNA-binding MarR family transcriptional regulator